MSTDLTTYQGGTALSEQMEYARVVSSGALLPQAYRGKPADILIAVGLGQAMGLSPAESLYRIDVIQGKPTASAELIAANVRKAGHKLRVQGDDTSATATIIRSDDPEFPFTVTRDVAWAQAMGLTSKDNYKKQPGTMLQWRAISAVARLACPEALYGVAYTPDEVRDTEPAPAPVKAAGLDAIRNAVASEPDPDPVNGRLIHPDADTVDAEVVEETGEAITDNTRKRMFALFTERGITDADQQRAGMSKVLGRTVESRADLTEADGQAIIASLEGRLA